MPHIEQSDPKIYEIIKNELSRQNNHLEMIASENFTYQSVMEACGSILTNKYAEGYPYKRYYGGCEYADGIEQLAIDRAKELFGCAYANVQPHSGSQANGAVFAALLKPYDKILGMSLLHGGHLTHGAKVNFSGQNYQSFSYGIGLDGYIDYERVADIAQIVKPKIIICGASAYAREIDFAKFREIADSVGALLMADIAHYAGLVVAGEYPNPFPYAHIVTTTTHKTLRGPRGGLVLTNDEEIAAKINKAIFPGIQGGPLIHIIAGKAVGFGENLKPEWKIYAKQVKANIKVFAEILMQRGYDIVSGGTDSHLALISLLNKDFSGKEAEEALGRAGITANKNMVPGEIRSPLVTSGIRIGSPALTARGMKDAEFEIIANTVADIFDDINNEVKQKLIRIKTKELASKFAIYDKAIY